MDINTEILIMSQGLDNQNCGFIIPVKFENYNIVVSPTIFEKKLKFRINNDLFDDCKSKTNGFSNSNNNNNSQFPAFEYCRNLTIGGFDDWYLPAKDELNFIYLNKYILPINYTFKDTFYWSSTEYSTVSISSTGAGWIICMFSGTQYRSKKDSVYSIRPIRRLII